MKLEYGELTYCLNVHPGSSLDETCDAVFHHAPRVFEQLRKLTGRPGPYGIGLWLSNDSAAQLLEAGLDSFRQRLTEAGLYLFTMNGFPFGCFHGTRVKQNVYLPDWSDPRRVAYTQKLARIMVELLPAGGSGSISTLPICYGAWATEELVRIATANLARLVCDLHQMKAQTGKTIRVLLEPEPDCFLEDQGTVIRYFEEILWHQGVNAVAEELDMAVGPAREILDRHLGICLDLIHCAVAFEDPVCVIRNLSARGVGIGKLHLGAALAAREKGVMPQALSAFNDEVYLHQTRLLLGDQVVRFADLSDAIRQHAGREGQWRVHYHIPMTWKGSDALLSTRDLVGRSLFKAAAEVGITHFEVETYTLGVFPDKTTTTEEILAAELAQVLQQI